MHAEEVPVRPLVTAAEGVAPAASQATLPAATTYEVTHTLEVGDLPEDARRVRVWCSRGVGSRDRA